MRKSLILSLVAALLAVVMPSGPKMWSAMYLPSFLPLDASRRPMTSLCARSVSPG